MARLLWSDRAGRGVGWQGEADKVRLGTLGSGVVGNGKSDNTTNKGG